MIRLLRSGLKRIVPRAWLAFFRVMRGLPRRVWRLERQVTMLAAERARTRHAGLLAEASDPVTAFARNELQVYAQQGEDGLLLALLEETGAPHRRFVEFGIGDGRECNTALLSIHFGWRGLLMEGDPERAAAAGAYYARVLGPRAGDVRIRHTMVTSGNINQLLAQHLDAPEVDVLSVDIDGVDYWVWKAITAIRPHIVVAEYNAVYGPSQRITVPYAPGFQRWAAHPGGLYYGASLAALAALGEDKGYRFVGCERHGVNAFFVRTDLPGPPAVRPEDAYRPQDDFILGRIDETRFSEIAHLPFERV